jgi:hypothetical protein
MPTRNRECPNQTVAGKCASPFLIRDPSRQHGVFERHQYAEISGRGIHGANERHQCDQHKIFEIWKRETGTGHQDRAAQQQIAEIISGCNEPDAKRQQRGPEQRCARDKANLHGIVADCGQICRQNDDGKAVAKSANPAGEIQQKDFGVFRHA